MYPAVYWCTFYDEVDKKMVSISGCTFGDNFTDVMQKIESYYGDTLNDVKIELMYPSSVIEFKTYEEAKKIVSDV